MVERGEHLRLARKASDTRGVVDEVRRQHLQGDVAAKSRVPGAIDIAHPTGAEPSGDDERPETSPNEIRCSLRREQPDRDIERRRFDERAGIRLAGQQRLYLLAERRIA